VVDAKEPSRLAIAIHEILSNSDKQAQLGEAAARASVHWSWDSIADAYLFDYQRLGETHR
jgi:glycosyltransferase involved in cell wall biosynthesis